MSLKLLIIEGPDRCGKNTLIQNFTSQAENSIVRHWGAAKGNTDIEKRNYQYQFFKKEFQLATERNKYTMPDTDRYQKDIYIWNRAHLGEFVYGDLYRNTQPRDWVMRMETDFSFDIDPSVYLVLLTAPAEFLCKRDDGLSFTDKIDGKNAELQKFHTAFIESKIMNKILINVSDGENYRSASEIFDEINKFIFK